MRYTLLAVLACVLGVNASGIATTVGTDEWKCPICGKEFPTLITPSYSSAGADAEGRPISLGADFQEFQLHDCPYCHYAGFEWNFKDAKDKPAGDAAKRIRDALTRQPGQFPDGALWPLERVKAAETAAIAIGAEPHDLEQIYQLGAWLADDAGESTLAATYREKALAQRLLWAEIDARTATIYSTAMRAYWAGRDHDALTGFRAARPALVVAEGPARKRYAATRKIILKRMPREDGGAEPPTEPADDGDADGEDLNFLLSEATVKERTVLLQIRAFKKLEYLLDNAATLAEWRDLGQAAALKRAQAGTFSDRESFIRVYGAGNDPALQTAIRGLIADPVGASTRPATEPADDNAISYANALTRAWQDVNPTGSSPPVDVATLPAQLREARAKEDGDSALGVVYQLGEHPSIAAADVLLDDLASHVSNYTDSFPLGMEGYHDWDVMALDEARCIRVADNLVQQVQQKKIEAKQARAALRPMAYAKGKETLARLIALTMSESPELRTEAAKCLLWRGDRRGVDAFLTAATTQPDELVNLEPALAAALLRLVSPDNEPTLIKLNTQWPGPIARKDDDKKAMAALVARAALARCNGSRHLAEYEKAIAELVASPIEGAQPAQLPWQDTVPARMEVLGWCANVYYVPSLGKELRPILAQGLSDYGTAGLVETVAAAGVQDLNDVFAAQLRRPLPMSVKIALARARGRLQVPGLDGVLQEWAKSKSPTLAEAAREALGTRAPQTKPVN